MELLDELWLSRHPQDVLFLELIEGYYLKESVDFPNELFYMKDDIILIDYDSIINKAYINNDLIWSVFRSEFYLNHQETIESMMVLLETHLKLKATPSCFDNGVKRRTMEAYLKKEQNITQRI